jgi:hypothetical protein
MTNSITIDWVRHGESCSNLLSGHVVDKPDNIKITVSAYKNMMAHKFEPPLSYTGIHHAINVGRYYLSILNPKPDIYITSALSRTIMTALCALRGDPKIIVYVVPYISELYKLSGGLDKQNTPVNIYNLKKRYNKIINWLKNFWLKYFYDDELIENIRKAIDRLTDCKDKYQLLQQFMEYKNIIRRNKNKTEKLESTGLFRIYTKLFEIDEEFRVLFSNKIVATNENNFHFHYPTINFEIYEKYPISSKPNYKLFVSEIIPKLITKSNKSNLKIMAFSHGLFMKDIFKNERLILKHINTPDETTILNSFMNTQIITQKLTDSKTTEINISPYTPKIMRQNVDYNFLEEDAIDICLNNDLKGILNETYSSNDKIIIDNKYPDVFKNKYLKYKNKYLTLLNTNI